MRELRGLGVVENAMARKAKIEVGLIPKSGRWILKKQGETAARASFDEKEDAIATGRLLAEAEHTSLEIHCGKGVKRSGGKTRAPGKAKAAKR